MKPINEKWFRERLAERDQSARALARYMDVDPSAISLILRGERRLQLEHVEAMAQFLDEPIEAVLDAAGLPVPALSELGRKVHICGRICRSGRVRLSLDPAILADVGLTWNDLTPPNFQSESIVVPLKPAPGSIAIEGEEGAPWAKWLFIVTQPGKQIAPEAYGRLALIRHDDEKPAFGTLEQGRLRGQWQVRLLSGEVEEIGTLQGAEPVQMIIP